jgi:hypothetical protein
LKRAEVAQGGLRSEYGGGAQNCRSLAQDIAIVWLPKMCPLFLPDKGGENAEDVGVGLEQLVGGADQGGAVARARNG